ncbi:hypothetical protein [Cystobacter fuscus]|uniref:hypothetical protein n=1 Tax=Cystobacter fuscus TaxID=43 RepID=UPI0012FD97AD|nr:hypothetical protein [Cystobacter fuscus]
MGLLAPIHVNERIIGFSLILNDITKLKQTQQRLEHSNQELESFAYVASPRRRRRARTKQQREEREQGGGAGSGSASRG